MPGPDFNALEQQYGLPPGFLAAQQQVESGGRDVTSSAGASGPAQLMPATARALGVNPHDPIAAADAQARLMRQNLDATNGDIDAAAKMYNAGPNRSHWNNPETHAYPGKILAALQGGRQPAQQPAPDSADPFEHVLSGGASSNDPFEAVLSGAKVAPDAQPNPVQTGQNSGGASDNLRGGAGQSDPVSVRPGPDPQAAGPVPEGTGQAKEGLAHALLSGAADFAQGVPEGYDNIQNSMSRWALKGTDAIGLTDNAVGGFDNVLQNVRKPYQDSLYQNPDGWARTGGNMVGETAPLLPVSEIKGFQISEETGALARALKYAGQGAAMGGVASGGNDVVRNMALGAAIAPVAGFGGEAIGNLASRVGKAAAPYTGPAMTSLKEALSDRFGKVPEVDPATIPDKPAWMNGANMSPEDVSQMAQLDEQGLTGEVTDRSPSASASKRRGIEAEPIHPDAQDHADELIGQSVNPAHAQNEAAIRYVGAEPTIASSSRDFTAQQAEGEAAKETGTTAGMELRSRKAANNQALHDAASQTVDNYGGIPAQGDAAEGAATSLAQASDAAKAGVTAKYNAARAADGDQRVSVDAVRELLAKPLYQAPTTSEGVHLANGLRAQIDAMAKANGGRFSPEEIDTLTKVANDAYNPMGGGANHMVGEVKNALGESLDQFDNAGPAYRAARAAHRDWAKQYDDPAGIANLIKRDANGNFVNSDKWRSVENGLIGTTNDKAFAQTVRQLQANGSTDALDKMKADIVQRAYERATNSAKDESGHAVFNGKLWNDTLNKIGMPKLKAIFSPEEIAHLATIGKAADAMHSPVPGAVNTSGTSAALLNALRAAKAKPEASKGIIGTAIEGALHLSIGHLAPGVGNLAVRAAGEGLGRAGAARASAKANEGLAAAIRLHMDPSAFRAAANENAMTAEALAKRQALARAIGAITSRGSGTITNQGNR